MWNLEFKKRVTITVVDLSPYFSTIGTPDHDTAKSVVFSSKMRGHEGDVSSVTLLINNATNFPNTARAAAGSATKEGSNSWLVTRMRHLIETTGFHQGLTTMFHIGRFSQSSIASQLWSTLCVAEFIMADYPLRAVCAGVPLTCVFDATSAFDNKFSFFVPVKAWWEYLRDEYERMRLDLWRVTGAKINSFATFQKDIHLARRVMERLAVACRSLCGNKESVVDPVYVCEHFRFLEIMLKDVAKRDLRFGGSLTALITPQSLEDAMRTTHTSTATESVISTPNSSSDGVSDIHPDSDLDSTSTSSGSAFLDSTFDFLDSDSFPWWDWTTETVKEIPVGKGKAVPAGKGKAVPAGKGKAVPAGKGKGVPADKRNVLATSSSIGKDVLASRKRKNNSCLELPRRQLPRSSGVANPVHFKEDVDIPERPVVRIVNKPGREQVEGGFLPQISNDSFMVAEELLFDDSATAFSPPPKALPTICIESFRGSDGSLVAGPYKYKDGDSTKAYDIGSDKYLYQGGEKKLTEVLCCKTTSAYVYFFKHANLRPHFVIGNEKASMYRKKLVGLDIDIRDVPSWKLKDPVKIVSDLSLVHGLREGRKEESDFMFVSSQTKLFQRYFGDDLAKLQFPTSRWMEFFDRQTTKSDNHGRNFQFGHHDCGYGREGVCASAHNSQDSGIAFVLGKPHTIGDREMMATLGPVLDRTTLMMDEICSENEDRLMNDPERDSVFGADMRAKTNSVHSRFEAYTIVRQPLGRATDVIHGNADFPSTSRHLDGPNCNRPGYTTTAVFSYLCVWKGTAYRTSIIMYTRQSCGNYCWRNFFARKLREKLRDYIVERNGGVHYGDFSLTESMARFRGEYDRRPNANKKFFLRPEDNDLSPTFFDRNPTSRWRHVQDREMTSPKWQAFDWEGKYQSPLYLIAVPEFFCRYGFVSSFASQINRFVWHQQLDTPDEMIYQLLYIALISSSQVQFYYVVGLLINEKKQLVAKYEESKLSSGGKTDVTLFRRYQRICETELNSMTGGPFNRIQAQPITHSIFSDDDSLRKNLEKFPQLVDDITDGRFLNANGILKERPGNALKVVGDVGSLSCAPLLVFVGMAKGVHAVNTAKQSLVNTTSRNSYYPALKKFLDDHDTAAPKMTKDEDFLIRLFKGIAKSWNTVIGSSENGCCALFRVTKKYDVYFRGQDIYNLDDTSDVVKVKAFGSETWVAKEF